MTHHIDAVQTDENLVVKKMGLFAVRTFITLHHPEMNSFTFRLFSLARMAQRRITSIVNCSTNLCERSSLHVPHIPMTYFKLKHECSAQRRKSTINFYDLSDID